MFQAGFHIPRRPKLHEKKSRTKRRESSENQVFLTIIWKGRELACASRTSGEFYRMNILIEDAETKEFLASAGGWTKIADKGAKFATTRAAYAAAKSEPIGKFNIVRYFAGTEQLINMEHGSGKRS
jgi:hypothetical protein